MSDCQKDLEVELREVVLVLKDVAGTQWYDLGLQLRLSPSTLDTIAAHHNTDDHKRMMLRKWLQSDPEASWERLAVALALTGHKTTAAVIRRQFSPVTTEVQEEVEDSTEEDKIRLMMTRKNLNKIKGRFSSLLVKVQSALKSHHVDVDEVRSFLVHYSSRDDWIRSPSSIDELFTALSVAKLWSYDHYDLLEEITMRLLPNDVNAKKLIVEYKGQLTGFYTTTKIADFIKLSDFEDSEQDPQQPLPTDSFTLKDYHKLKLKLKLDRKVSAVTLSYVDELWRSLAEEFDLPCLTAVIHSIIEGSLMVTWLILPHVAEKIIASSSTAKAINFFRFHGILSVEIDNDTVYDEKHMIKFRLFEVCSEGTEDVSIISELQNLGVDFNKFTNEGYTPLCIASSFGNSNVVRALLEHGAQVNKHSNDKWGITPLMAACCNDHTSAAMILIENGAIVDLLNKAGQSPLYVACAYGQTAAVRFLLEHGADVNLPTDDAVGCSALIAACLDGFVDVARVLLEYGANVHYQDKMGHFALYGATSYGKTETVTLLVQSGANINLSTNDGRNNTALISACFHGYSEIARILLDHGADADYQNKGGCSAIFYAAEKGFVDIVQLLMEHGVDLELKDEDELTAYDIASINSHSAVCRLMETYGYQTHHSTSSEANSVSRITTGLQTRHWHDDEVTSVRTFRAILEHGSRVSQDVPKHPETSNQISKETCEEN